MNYDSGIHFELFVQFAETGSCDSYDQYNNDRNNCNINQLPRKPEIINYYQGIIIIKVLLLSRLLSRYDSYLMTHSEIFSSFEN